MMHSSPHGFFHKCLLTTPLFAMLWTAQSALAYEYPKPGSSTPDQTSTPKATASPCVESHSLMATGSSGTMATYSVPSCAHTMNFTIVGASGGQLGYGGGYGANITGSIVVSPGQSINVTAGGAGGTNVAGTSAYGNGGAAFSSGGGGGAASALYLDGVLIAVAGGGGGGGVSVGNGGPMVILSDKNTGAAGTQGISRVIAKPPNTFDQYFSKAIGGMPGSATGPGAGGTYAGYQTAVNNGLPGVGSAGGAGVPNAQTGLGGTYGGSGGGGGGYNGGGSGASLWWSYTGGTLVIPAGGGGGSSYTISKASNVVQTVGATSVGGVKISFS